MAERQDMLPEWAKGTPAVTLLAPLRPMLIDTPEEEEINDLVKKFWQRLQSLNGFLGSKQDHLLRASTPLPTAPAADPSLTEDILRIACGCPILFTNPREENA